MKTTYYLVSIYSLTVHKTIKSESRESAYNFFMSNGYNLLDDYYLMTKNQLNEIKTPKRFY